MLQTAKEIIRPFYTTEEEDQIDCGLILEDDQKARMVINKLGQNGLPNADWELIHEKVGQEELDKNTQDFRDEMKSQHEREEANKQRILGEELFNLKLEVFEMPEIRQSKNTKLKSKIRRAANKTQAMLYASALIQEEMSKPEDETMPAPKLPSVEPTPLIQPEIEEPKKKTPAKKAATKKRTPRKKKANTEVGKVTIVDTINDDQRDK